MAFGALLGELSVHLFPPDPADKPEVIRLDHPRDNPPAPTDIRNVGETIRKASPPITVLRAKVVPVISGDTGFSTMSANCRGSSKHMKRHIDRRWGRRVLDVNRQVCVRIRGLEADASDALLAFLCRQATIPECQWRVRWQPNTAVI